MEKRILDRLRDAASAGDHAAQYQLAGALSASGSREESEQWLLRAVKGGSPDALYTIATRSCGTLQGIASVVDELKAAAAKGCAPAMTLLCVLHARGWGVTPDARLAVQYATKAAQTGDPSGMAAVGACLHLVDPDNLNGAVLTARASERGSSVAAAVRVRRFLAGAEDDPRTIERLLTMLEKARYPNAGALRAGIARGGARASSTTIAGDSIDWNNVQETLATAPAVPVNSSSLLDRPHAWTCGGLWSATACEYVIATAARGLAPSRIVDPGTGVARPDPYRSSLTAVIGPVDLDLAIVRLTDSIANAAGEPVARAEFISILCYGPGQEYRPHFDWLPDGPDVELAGQRTTTALVYLNEEFEGGETAFVDAGVSYRGSAGDMLAFRNASADGERDMASRHAGRPVVAGVKWVASQWFRSKKFAF
ncbi:MAG: hypothetical protein GC152_06510 [Alphaproteobacteria bacterium]|nr:hypothetical protein [Alphaproteobacteria bacterium]